MAGHRSGLEALLKHAKVLASCHRAWMDSDAPALKALSALEAIMGDLRDALEVLVCVPAGLFPECEVTSRNVRRRVVVPAPETPSPTGEPTEGQSFCPHRRATEPGGREKSCTATHTGANRHPGHPRLKGTQWHQQRSNPDMQRNHHASPMGVSLPTSKSRGWRDAGGSKPNRGLK